MSLLVAKLTPHTLEGKKEARKTLSRVKSVSDFLADLIGSVKHTGLLDALAEHLPWAAPLGAAVADAVPPIRFLVKLFRGLGEIHDPDLLGYLACTMAYQQALQQALPEIPGATAVGKREIRSELRDATPEELYDFSRFSYDEALTHLFVVDADRYLETFGAEIGLTEAEIRELEYQVHVRFVPNLKVILSHGKTRAKFAPFASLLTLGSDEARAYAALLEHADHQRWLFEEKRVLGREPFSLRHVYLDTDCGRLRWGEIDTSRQRASGSDAAVMDPFSEKCGGRHSLADTVWELIADPGFDDAIVLQGLAGSGKSSLTLRLCWELIRQGLRPIRIELKDLDTRESVSIAEALPAAVRITCRERHPHAEKLFFGPRLFLDNRIFDQTVRFRGAVICPYVLILDGWDEISVGASVGYQQQVERMLSEIRQTFLERRAVPVRVILTGRPTEAVEKSKFLRRDTAILTIRPLAPAKLESFIHKLKWALAEKPNHDGKSATWSLDQVSDFPAIIDRYRRDFEAREAAPDGASRASGAGLDVFGSPLLAHLALRLMAEWRGDVKQLMESPTILYRSLVDLVIGKGGKPDESDFDPEGRPALVGHELRRLLRATAEAMTALGEETISKEELAVRLELDDDELAVKADDLTGDQVLSRLMISFFFKGGMRELGCEFSHKSFREYLFAEQVVETLKDYGRRAEPDLSERPEARYWQEFDEQDPRRVLCTRLAELLGPKWMTPDVAGHITELLRWEIARAYGEDPYPAVGMQTLPLAVECWDLVRDGLADAWDWWGEGVHLRPQPRRKRRSRDYDFEPPLALVIAENDRQRAGSRAPIPIRLVTVDSHLGDGLFRLAGDVHREIATRLGCPDATEGDLWAARLSPGRGARRYQRRIVGAEQTFLVFAPSGENPLYFANYRFRINAAGYRPLGEFPTGASLAKLDLSGVKMPGFMLARTDLAGADLSEADLRRADLRRADLRRARLVQTDLRAAVARDADFGGADLESANLRRAQLFGCDFTAANLEKAILRLSDADEATVAEEQLDRARVSED